MTGKQLKNAILQLAIQGKLVPQDAADEPASALLAKIRKEKEQLLKAGKLKKKDLETTPITDDEKPFEIPESWEWVRLKDVCTKIVDGDHNPPSGLSTKTEYLMISSKNVNFDRLVELDSVRYLSKEIFEIENQRTDAKVGDILFTSVGTLGRSCIIEQNNLNICFQRSVSIINTLTYNKYLKRCLDSPYIQFFVVENATGTAQKGFYLSQMEKLVIPLPPLAEQHRIVSKIEELMPLVEEYGVAQEKLNRLNEALPEALKKSILQQAIQGKLVPQDANDEPASALLSRIRKEKEQLVKAGKIALSKPEKKFKEKLEFPFEIPNLWTWCSLYDVCRVFGRIGFRGYTKEDLVKYKEDGAITISPTNIINGELDFSICTYLSEDKYNESPEIMVEVGDILLVKTASCGKTALVNELPWKATINPQIALLKDIMINREYLSLLLKSPYIQSKIHDFTIGTSIPTFSQEIMLTLNIPLPPLSEQHRIVAKIEELMAMVDGMR